MLTPRHQGLLANVAGGSKEENHVTGSVIIRTTGVATACAISSLASFQMYYVGASQGG